MFDFKPTHRVVSKTRYHMYALHEEVMQISSAYNFVVDGYEFVNKRGIRQHLNLSEVEVLTTASA